MSTKGESKTKSHTKPAKSKGSRSAGRSPAKPRTAKPKGAKPKTNRGGARWVGRGVLYGLVIADMREGVGSLPLGASAIAKVIERSSGAVGNCLERLAKTEDSPVRRVADKPQTYDLKAEAPGTSA